MNIRKALKEKRIYFDGGFGTLLQEMGLPAGVPPEEWNLTNPDAVTSIHRAYIEAGSNVITTNTFGVNCEKYENYEEYILRAIECAKTAAQWSDCAIAFDIGPCGKMLEPLGELTFEGAVELFAANVRCAAKAGVDLIIIETMNDSYETKAAVLAAKENSTLPVFVTNVYDKGGKLMTGATPEAMTAMLEGLGVDALGLNCSLGPDLMLPLIDRFIENSSLPVIANPNAGLPTVVDGKTVYNVSADEFAEYMRQIAEKGVTVLGGCCGTTPEYIRKTVSATENLDFVLPEKKNKTVVSSYTHAVEVGLSPVLIGERINPTGKPPLKDALRREDYNYVLNEGINQAERGAHILDVNAGLPDIDEAQTMMNVVKKLQSVTDLPLQLDSSSPVVLEKSMRIYNGKPLINSVNGEEKSMSAVFPLVQKYGGTVIALTMDEGGIPKTAKERVEIAERIAARAKEYGIEKRDIIVDPLCLTVSSDTKSALVTLDAVKSLSQRGFKTSLGVSNISFGLPHRDRINSSFFNSALESGLNCAIMNPFSQSMMDVYYSFRALHDMDAACSDYIAYVSDKPAEKAQSERSLTLKDAVVKGLKEEAAATAAELVKTQNPLDVISGYIVPALNDVGKDFEQDKVFLPQLLMSADAATAAFEVIKRSMPKGSMDESKAMVLATVKGDIHDIGKNIVKVLLESYGFKVYDLGKDVPPEKVLECVRETGCRLVGLSALMTTTVPSMEETIKLLHSSLPDVTVVVGGAVLTEEYAEKINADKYCADAMATVRFTSEYYNQEEIDIVDFDYYFAQLKSGEMVDETCFYFIDDPKETEHYIGYLPDIKKPYWSSYCDIPTGTDYKTAEELINAPIWDGKSLKERWENVRICHIEGISLNEWLKQKRNH